MIKPCWPSEAEEKTILAVSKSLSGETGLPGAASIYIRSILLRVRELERALAATGYFRDPEIETQWYFDRWLEATEYAEAVDKSLDGIVPSRCAQGPIWLAGRVMLLIDKCRLQQQQLLEHRQQQRDKRL